jgi:hypothetical protein
LRGAARDLRSGSGLTANRKNLPNASELCLAFNWASRSPRPALCYRPLLAFPPHFEMLRVTALEPRTPHQPEKLKKLSKNDSVVLLLVLESTKSVHFYLIYFQWSAGRPQAGDRNLCRWRGQFRTEGRRAAGFARRGRPGAVISGFCERFAAVKTWRKPRRARDLRNWAAQGEGGAEWEIERASLYPHH